MSIVESGIKGFLDITSDYLMYPLYRGGESVGEFVAGEQGIGQAITDKLGQHMDIIIPAIYAVIMAYAGGAVAGAWAEGGEGAFVAGEEIAKDTAIQTAIDTAAEQGITLTAEEAGTLTTEVMSGVQQGMTAEELTTALSQGGTITGTEVAAPATVGELATAEAAAGGLAGAGIAEGGGMLETGAGATETSATLGENIPAVGENASLSGGELVSAGAGTTGTAATTATGGSSWQLPAALAASSVLQGIIGYKAAGNAADTAAAASDRAIQAQVAAYLQTREDLAPWRESGARAVGELEKTVMAGPGEFKPEEQPGYQFGYKEFVEKPLLQNASATGKLRSGNILRSLSDRAQDYASLSYDNWLNRWLTKMQPLQSLAGLGQTSASTTAQTGTQTAGTIAQTTLAGGQAQATGQINQANALTGAIGGARNVLLDAYLINQMQNQNNLLRTGVQ